MKRQAFFAVVMFVAVLILIGGAWSKELPLAGVMGISESGLKAIYGQTPSNLSGINTTTVSYSIDIADCAISQTMDGYEQLVINSLSVMNNPGKPQLPVKTLVVKLSRDAEVLGIEVVSGSYRKIQCPVNIAPCPAPYVWMRQEDMPPQLRKRLKLASVDTTIYGLDEFFPGEIATYNAGRDNSSTYVYVRVFPVQYIPKTKEAILVTDAAIKVYYTLPPGQGKTSKSPDEDPAECVIICPPDLASAAGLLRDFHINHENVSTTILTTVQISTSYSPAPDPVYRGYKDNYAGRDRIIGYNYVLAKKIITYLRRQAEHPNLKYIVLFGDGALVPPSYYLNEWGEYGYESYYDWIPTDFLYTSPDYDFIPNYKVGRLPVSNAAQATAVVNKITRWHNSLSWNWFKRASVGGGRPFGTMYYYGELSHADLINKDTFNGMELTKYFYTSGNYGPSQIGPLFSTEDTGLFYHVDHGSGDRMYFQDNSLGAADVMGYPLNAEVPLVCSVSCINGAYDTDLTQFSGQPAFPAVPYPTSFGESVVLSNAGGIAYLGGARLNYAGWAAAFDQGRLFASHYYMCQLLNNVCEIYHHGVSRIGDMTYNALKFYSQDNSMHSPINRETIFGFVLLGDPVVSLPSQQPGPSYQKPYMVASEPDRYSGDNIPRYEDLPPDPLPELSVVCSSDSPTLNTKSIYTWRDSIIGSTPPTTPPVTHIFSPADCGYYLVRASAEDGKEGWLYLNAQFEFVATSDILFIDGDYAGVLGEDYDQYYTDALDNLGRTYDIWETGARDPIDAETLSNYLNGVVIWGIPIYPPPREGEKAACQSYLDSGGRLFITGQDVGFYLTQYGSWRDYFYEQYMHAQFVGDDPGIRTLSGVSADPIGDGLTITIQGGDGANNQYYPDEIDVISPAVPVFNYALGREGALRVDTGTYKVVYFSFGFEGINSQAHRDEVMRRVLEWLAPGPIQEAIDRAENGDEVVIEPGVYEENINFRGKSITLRSINPDDPAIMAATVIDGRPHSSVATFSSGEGANSILAGFTITGGNKGILCFGGASPTIAKCAITGTGGAGVSSGNISRPTLNNCIIAGNRGAGVEMWGTDRLSSFANINNCTIVSNTQCGVMGGIPTICNSIIYYNAGGINCVSPTVTYCDVEGSFPGEGNINADPCFVREPDDGGDGWADDPVTELDEGANDDYGDLHLLPDSPCIDAGDPGFVPEPNQTDIDGQPRILDGDDDGISVVDMGVDERLAGCQTCLGDLNGDNWIMISDLFEMMALLNRCGPPYICPEPPQNPCADMDQNGFLMMSDLFTLIAMLGAAEPPYIIPCP